MTFCCGFIERGLLIAAKGQFIIYDGGGGIDLNGQSKISTRLPKVDWVLVPPPKIVRPKFKF